MGPLLLADLAQQPVGVRVAGLADGADGQPTALLDSNGAEQQLALPV